MRHLFVSSALLLTVSLASAVEWPHLVTTFGAVPYWGKANDEQPRTEEELIDDNWVKLSSCEDNHFK
jgi:hypothetical protein